MGWRVLHLMVLILILMGSGCSTDKKQLEKLGLTNSIGFDSYEAENKNAANKVLVTASVPVISAGGKQGREVLTVVSHSSKDAWLHLARQTNKILVSGQLRNALFGIELAEQGLLPHLDTLVRDPAIGQRVNVVIVNGQASKLLNTSFKNEPATGQYIYRFLEKEKDRSKIPDISIYHFTRDLYDDGIDPVAPLLKLHQDKLMLDGVGLFDEDRYITKIPFEDTLVFAGLRGDIRQGEISIQFQDGKDMEIVTYSAIANKRKIKINRDPNGNIRAKINLQVTGSLLEYIGELQVSQTKDRAYLENQTSKYLQKKAVQLLSHLQKHNVDSLGIGKYVRNSMRYEEWNSLDWRKVYPGIQIECDVNVTIRDYGKFQ